MPEPPNEIKEVGKVKWNRFMGKHECRVGRKDFHDVDYPKKNAYDLAEQIFYSGSDCYTGTKGEPSAKMAMSKEKFKEIVGNLILNRNELNK